MTPNELAQRLSEDTESIVRILLPAGKKSGNEWRVGSLAGEAGTSLGIHLAGNKAGVWADFATGEGGDLLDLWAKVSRISIKEAIKEVKKYLGVYEPSFNNKPYTYKKPAKPKCKKLVEQSKVFEYLTQKRKLTKETLDVYKIADGGDSIIFPFLRNGEPVMIKRLALERKDGKKDIRPTSPEQEPCLFGWQAIPDSAREITICEGEIDAMSSYQFGHPALSVPFGGGKGAKQAWIENEYDSLLDFDVIYLCLDNDQEGNAAVEEISTRLGKHRCRKVVLPEKDMNECLQKGYEYFDIDVFFSEAKTVDPAELKPASVYTDLIIREFYPPDGWNTGFLSPWSKIRGRLKFRPGEVCIIAGVNGHGKSVGVGHITIGAISQGEKACVASLEFKPQKWLMRIVRQISGVDIPAIPYIKKIQNWLSDKLWVFDVVGTAKAKKIIEVFIYAKQRYGIRFFVIDNMSKLDIGLEDYDAQRNFIDDLTDFAKVYDTHVILVAHTRKGKDDSTYAGKMDIKGTGALTDLVDTVLIWWRNRPKEDKLRDEGLDEKKTEALLNQPDAIVKCEKQRNGEDEPKILLWFHHESQQFLERQAMRPYVYVDVEQS